MPSVPPEDVILDPETRKQLLDFHTEDDWRGHPRDQLGLQAQDTWGSRAGLPCPGLECLETGTALPGTRRRSCPACPPTPSEGGGSQWDTLERLILDATFHAAGHAAGHAPGPSTAQRHQWPLCSHSLVEKRGRHQRRRQAGWDCRGNCWARTKESVVLQQGQGPWDLVRRHVHVSQMEVTSS